MDVPLMQRDNERRACLEADQGPRVQWRALLDDCHASPWSATSGSPLATRSRAVRDPNNRRCGIRTCVAPQVSGRRCRCRGSPGGVEFCAQHDSHLPGRSVRPPRLTRCATDVGRMDGSPRVREYTRKYAVVVTQFVTQLKGVPGYGTARQQDQGRGPR